jgi:hypothetical protein
VLPRPKPLLNNPLLSNRLANRSFGSGSMKNPLDSRPAGFLFCSALLFSHARFSAIIEFYANQTVLCTSA